MLAAPEHFGQFKGAGADLSRPFGVQRLVCGLVPLFAENKFDHPLETFEAGESKIEGHVYQGALAVRGIGCKGGEDIWQFDRVSLNIA